jgi:hypothetical protein
VCSRATPSTSNQGRGPQQKCRPRRLRRLLQRDPAGAGAPRPQNPLAASGTPPTLNDRVLVLATGKTRQEITAECKGARPNHVGAAIARHKRAGRIEERNGKLYAR